MASKSTVSYDQTGMDNPMYIIEEDNVSSSLPPLPLPEEKWADGQNSQNGEAKLVCDDHDLLSPKYEVRKC